MSSTPSFVAIPRSPTTSIANADAVAFKTLFAAGANGSRVDSIFASNSDTANAYVIQLSIQKSGIDYVIGEVSIPIGAGTNSVAKVVAALNPSDLPPLSYTESNALFLEAGSILRVRTKTTVAGANTVQLFGVAGDY